MNGIDFSLLNLSSISVMLVLCLFALFLLCISIFNKGLSRNFYVMTTIIAFLLSIGLILGVDKITYGLFNLIIIDGFSIISILLMLIISMFFISMSLSKSSFFEYSLPEFFVIFLFMMTGYAFMVSSYNLILIFIGLETSSLALYTLVAMHNRKFSVEAALKYFVMGAISSGFFVFGSALLYFISGSVDILTIASIVTGYELKDLLIISIGAIFLMVAIGFKLSLVPFHTWLPDVYEGASEVMAGFISIVPKIAGFVVAIRFFESFINSGVYFIEITLMAIAIFTMTLGNLAALVQVDIKRMLAFSSISHSGFLLAGMVVATNEANAAIFSYWLMFSFANLGAFCILWMNRQMKNSFDERFDHPFSKYFGTAKSHPLMALAMAIFMFSLSGIPPFSVFWGKMYIISAVVSSEFYLLAVIMIINSAIAVYYYLRVAVVMFLKEPNSDALLFENSSKTLEMVVAICIVICILAILVLKLFLPYLQSLLLMN